MSPLVEKCATKVIFAELQTLAMCFIAQACSTSSTEHVNLQGAHIIAVHENHVYKTTMPRHLYFHSNLRLLNRLCDTKHPVPPTVWDVERDVK